MRWGVVVILGLGLLLPGCGSRRPTPVEPVAGATQTGIASWYGPRFHGRQTASGEIYNQYDLTAAHQTLPHGTQVRVINLANGREVLVRINDRGPFVDDRIIDLSYTAAQHIEMIGPGTAPVRLEVLGAQRLPEVQMARPPTRVPVPAVAHAAAVEPIVPVAAPAPTIYAVQIGAFTDYAHARRVQESLASSGTRAHLGLVEEGGTRYYRLRLGPFSRERAAQAARQVSQLGYPALIVASGVSR
ncbi:MAG: septal ring lytic transglycosylase RlpA family protein [Candidatus Binatia bacterium]